MNKVMLDETLRSKLGNLSQESQICDEEGQVVGLYVPMPEHDPELHRWAEAQISDEELERRAQEPGGRSTAEVLKRLEKL